MTARSQELSSHSRNHEKLQDTAYGRRRTNGEENYVRTTEAQPEQDLGPHISSPVQQPPSNIKKNMTTKKVEK